MENFYQLGFKLGDYRPVGQKFETISDACKSAEDYRAISDDLQGINVIKNGEEKISARDLELELRQMLLIDSSQ